MVRKTHRFRDDRESQSQISPSGEGGRVAPGKRSSSCPGPETGNPPVRPLHDGWKDSSSVDRRGERGGGGSPLLSTTWCLELWEQIRCSVTASLKYSSQCDGYLRREQAPCVVDSLPVKCTANVM